MGSPVGIRDGIVVGIIDGFPDGSELGWDVGVEDVTHGVLFIVYLDGLIFTLLR